MINGAVYVIRKKIYVGVWRIVRIAVRGGMSVCEGSVTEAAGKVNIMGESSEILFNGQTVGKYSYV